MPPVDVHQSGFIMAKMSPTDATTRSTKYAYSKDYLCVLVCLINERINKIRLQQGLFMRTCLLINEQKHVI